MEQPHDLPWESVEKTYATQPAPIEEDVQRHVIRLAAVRQQIAAVDAQIKTQRAAFESTLATSLQVLEGLKREAEVTEGTVRALALVVHETTGNKAPCTGVTVVVGKEIAIDEAAGLAWANATGMCLIPAQLDVKAVKKMATVTALPFVTVTPAPSVRIATDLGKVLANPLGDTP